ncbi:MAG: hypothetical protein J6Z09_01345 [Lachnospiraceae bacterium]|nr:hypothetical protein [Lachnospiraceae bacterium]MBP5297775.1 hypothetical protein [Lachnospiraceae bacterium]
MNEQNLKLEAVKKRCNIAAKITGIIQTLVIIGAVIAFLAGILLFVRGQEWNPLLGQAVEAGKLNLNSTIDYNGLFDFTVDLVEKFGPGNYVGPLGITCFVASFVCIAIAIVVTFIKKIFTVIKQENNPFSERAMNQIKIGFIVIGIATLLATSVGFGLITGFILFCIYAIFEYGAALQNEIDETL